MTSTEAATRARPEGTPRWYQRVLPVTALALAVVALAAATLPGFRHQLALSASHQPQEYAELYFARTPAGTQAICSRGGDVRARFAVTSHFERPRVLAYVVATGATSTRGTVFVTPDRTVTVARALPSRAGRPYDLTVRLPELHQALHAHCGGTAR